METTNQSSNNRTFIIGAVLIGIVIVGFGIYGLGVLFNSQSGPDIIYDDAPAISFTDIEDNTYQLEQFEENTPVILYFHYIGCTYCNYHGPRLEHVTNEYTTDQLRVFAITVHPDLDTNSDLEFWSDYGNHDTWNNVRDFGYNLTTAFSVSGVPHTVFINKQGQVTNATVGLQTSDDIETMVDTIMGS